MEADRSGVVGDQRCSDPGPPSRSAGGREKGNDSTCLHEGEEWAEELGHSEVVEVLDAVGVGQLSHNEVGHLEHREGLSRTP